MCALVVSPATPLYFSAPAPAARAPHVERAARRHPGRRSRADGHRVPNRHKPWKPHQKSRSPAHGQYVRRRHARDPSAPPRPPPNGMYGVYIQSPAQLPLYPVLPPESVAVYSGPVQSSVPEPHTAAGVPPMRQEADAAPKSSVGGADTPCWSPSATSWWPSHLLTLEDAANPGPGERVVTSPSGQMVILSAKIVNAGHLL